MIKLWVETKTRRGYARRFQMKVQFLRCGRSYEGRGTAEHEQFEMLRSVFPDAEIEIMVQWTYPFSANADRLSGATTSIDAPSINGWELLSLLCDRRLAVGTRLISWWDPWTLSEMIVYLLTETGWVREHYVKL